MFHWEQIRDISSFSSLPYERVPFTRFIWKEPFSIRDRMVSIERSFIVFNVFHRLVVHTFAVSTVTTALLTNTQYVRNAIGRQTFLCRFIYNREQIYSISDRIWDQTEKEREKKGEREKKTWGKKEQKKKNVEGRGNPINIKTIVLCTRISLQTFVFIGSVQKLNYVK